jgi:hypothetical protein
LQLDTSNLITDSLITDSLITDSLIGDSPVWNLVYRSPEPGRLSMATLFLFDAWTQASYRLVPLAEGQYVEVTGPDSTITLLHHATLTTADHRPPRWHGQETGHSRGWHGQETGHSRDSLITDSLITDSLITDSLITNSRIEAFGFATDGQALIVQRSPEGAVLKVCTLGGTQVEVPTLVEPSAVEEGPGTMWRWEKGRLILQVATPTAGGCWNVSYDDRRQTADRRIR